MMTTLSDQKWEELMQSADTVKVSTPRDDGDGYDCTYYRVNHDDRTLTEIDSSEFNCGEVVKG